MVSLLTIERMHNTRLGRLQKLHLLTHTEEEFRGGRKRAYQDYKESQCLK